MRAKRYLVTDTVTVSGNAEPGRMDGETVDADWVQRFIDIDARRFFINLGGTEEYSKSKAGVIRCKSTSPDRETVRVVRFTPVRN